MSAEFLQHFLRPGLGVDGSLEIVRDLHILAALVGAVPAPIGLCRLDLLEPVLRHPACLNQPGNVVDIDLAPDTLLAARRVALQLALAVEPLARRVDPAPAECDIDGFLWSDRFESRIHVVDFDPDLGFLVVVLTKPLVETLGVLELADSVGVDLDGRHQPDPTISLLRQRSRPKETALPKSGPQFGLTVADRSRSLQESA